MDPLTNINFAFKDTIARDPNLTEDAKDFFRGLIEDNEGKDDGSCARAFESVALLLKRNYIYIDGFPSNVPTPDKNRTRWQLRLAALKQLFTGEPA